MAGQQPGKNVFREVAPERITVRGMIIDLFQRAQEHKAIVFVTVPGSKTRYLSLILDVDAANGFLLLDELNPATGHEQLLAAGRFQARFTVNGVEISFAGVIDDVSRRDDINLYKVAMPSVVFYHQRRAFFRAHVSLAHTVPVSFTREDVAEEVNGRLHDISVGGVGARIHNALAHPLTRGEIVPNCIIELPAGTVISSSVEIRYAGKRGAATLIQLGGKFVDLDRQQQKIIERFVTELERELIRKMPKR